MKHSIPHDLSHEQARDATRHALESYRARFAEYKPTGAWLSPDRATVQFTVAGKTLSGTVDVLPKHIDLELDVPLIFRPFRSVAIKVIEDEIREWIARARTGNLA